MMDRVNAINAKCGDPYTKVKLEHECVFKVETVVVFGSYLTARPKIGDIDVAIVLKRRKQSNAEHETSVEQSKARVPRPCLSTGGKV
jgi:predicted nucleotidyltransferase